MMLSSTADDFRHDVHGASDDGHDGSLLLSDVPREGQHYEHRDIRGGARPARHARRVQGALRLCLHN